LETAPAYRRWLTREVKIGNLLIGGQQPIRIQSMTNTPTMDTKASVNQAVRLIHAGCEFVRIAVPGMQEAINLSSIKEGLVHRGYTTPLIADVHFSPAIAEEAARRVEKIRINPGNYCEERPGLHAGFTDKTYEEARERIHARLLPLLAVCRQYGTAIRIGINHGSLSERIMNRYGDTPQGMVESAMEYIRIIAGEGFHSLVISMKASSVRISTLATRSLVLKMQEEGFNYPLHLGITEAGDEEDGRIKSACGIGSLLEEGLGDTIRVSLTGEPERELPVARMIAAPYNQRNGPYSNEYSLPSYIDPGVYSRRSSRWTGRMGSGQSPAVVTTCLGKAGYRCYFFHHTDYKPDYLYEPPGIMRYEHPPDTRLVRHIYDYDLKHKAIHPLVDAVSFTSLESLDLPNPWINLGRTQWREETARVLAGKADTVLVIHKMPDDNIHQIRQFIGMLQKHDCRQALILRLSYPDYDIDQFHIRAATEAAFLLNDGLPDALWLEWKPEASCKLPTMAAFDILQATGDRLSRTEYIACPSCGRTQFDIEKVLATIKERTGHLKGLKIAVMGCIVNGPGEMADAHYGYVGAGKGKVNLYKGKTLEKSRIEAQEAVEELISLIKAKGDWKEAAGESEED